MCCTIIKKTNILSVIFLIFYFTPIKKMHHDRPERIKILRRGMNWAQLKILVIIKSYTYPISPLVPKCVLYCSTAQKSCTLGFNSIIAWQF